MTGSESPPGPTVRVVVVDDHPVVRDGIVGMLSGRSDVEVVAQAANGREALLQVERHDPDVVLMDLRMPEMDGVAAITELTHRRARARVLVLTTYDDDEDVVAAVEAGATGYLLKDAPHDELYRAIQAASRGQTTLAPAVASRLLGRMRTPRATLSPRETEVLEHAARGRTNREIGRAMHVSEATVKTHLLRAFEKLEVSDRTAAVVVAMERGLLTLNR